jgi:hypothetical protein
VNNAFGLDLGATYHKFSADLVYQLYNQAISVLNPLLGPQSLAAPYQSTTNSVNENPITGANLISTDNTLYGIVTDNNAFLARASTRANSSSSMVASNTSGRTTLTIPWARAPRTRAATC